MNDASSARGAQLGVAERVADALRGDRILVVAGVADERPAGSVRLAEEVGHGAAVEALLAGRAADPLGELGRELERLQVVGLDVGLVRRRLGGGPADDQQRQAVVGRERGPAPVGADDDLESRRPAGRSSTCSSATAARASRCTARAAPPWRHCELRPSAPITTRAALDHATRRRRRGRGCRRPRRPRRRSRRR